MAYCGPRGIALSTFLSWSPEDQDAALAWQDDQARRCNRCGTHPEDWSEFGAAAYHVERHVCRGCLRLSEGREKHKESAHEREASYGLAPGPSPD